MRIRILAVAVVCIAAVLLTAVARAADAPRQWPDVLVIDDFEHGLGNWENQDAGKLTLTDDAPQGKKALLWTAGDDGIGHIILKQLSRKNIDFSQYDILMFRVKVAGKPIWNINPVIQQYHAVYGYRGLYCSVDTMHLYDKWYIFTQDLRRWENAWPDTFSTDKQEFQFEVQQLAGAGHTQIYLDEIKLVKNTLGIDKSTPGTWGLLPDGSQVTHFRVKLRNNGKSPVTVRARMGGGGAGNVQHFRVELPAAPAHLLPGEEGEMFVRIVAPADVVKKMPVYYGETAQVGFTVDETPGLLLFSELTAGTRPAAVSHPTILCDAKRMQDWRRQYANPDTRKTMERDFRSFVSYGEKSLSYEPAYPPLGIIGDAQCPFDKTKLTEISVPNLPFREYQCPTCGRPFSGPVYDAGMQNWARSHLQNAAQARNLAFAYGITGRKEFAIAAAAILRAYIDRYLKLPISAPSAGSPVYSHTSGATRIGSTYMLESRWLTDMAIALDFVRTAGILTPEELHALSENVLAPSANLMMDHKVGAMNLQWMIQAAALYGGLASENPAVIARAIYSRHGVVRLMAVGYGAEGLWWENPSYQNVANGVSFPVLATCVHSGLLPWNDRLANIFKGVYRMYGPDGRGPTLGTGGPGGYSCSNNAVHSLASFVNDPELAWVAYHQPMWRAWSGGGQPYSSYLWALTWQGKPRLPEAKTKSPIPDGTTILPDYGGIALRVPGRKNYCYLHYGREVVHGHRNKLSINAYAKGHWFVRNVMGGYGDNFKNFLETIASSTSVMIDGKNPDADTGQLLFHKSGPGWEAACAREIGAWKDVEHERAVVLTTGPLIVVDRCASKTDHTYDWLYQSALTRLDLDLAAFKPHDKPLGETRLYESLHPLGAAVTPATVTLTRKDAGGLKIALLGAGDLFAFKALKKYDGLLWRRRGKTVGFAAALWPYAKGEKGDVTITALPVTDARGKPVSLTAAQAVRVTAPEGAWTVLVNYTGQPLACDGLNSKAPVSVTVKK